MKKRVEVAEQQEELGYMGDLQRRILAEMWKAGIDVSTPYIRARLGLSGSEGRMVSSAFAHLVTEKVVVRVGKGHPMLYRLVDRAGAKAYRPRIQATRRKITTEPKPSMATKPSIPVAPAPAMYGYLEGIKQRVLEVLAKERVSGSWVIWKRLGIKNTDKAQILFVHSAIKALEREGKIKKAANTSRGFTYRLS